TRACSSGSRPDIRLLPTISLAPSGRDWSALTSPTRIVRPTGRSDPSRRTVRRPVRFHAEWTRTSHRAGDAAPERGGGKRGNRRRVWNWAEAVTSAQFTRHAASLKVPATRPGDSGGNPTDYLHLSTARSKRFDTSSDWLDDIHRALNRSRHDGHLPASRTNLPWRWPLRSPSPSSVMPVRCI